MELFNELQRAAAEAGQEAARQLGRLGRQAGAGARLLQARRELRAQYEAIGRACWERYRREAEPLFPRELSRIRALEEECRRLEESLRGERPADGEARGAPGDGEENGRGQPR